MKYIDDIDLSGGTIYNAKIESLNVDPDFTANDAGRIYFNILEKILKLNNGTTYIDVSLPANFESLISTLGSNWITPTFTFNPTPFNALNNITGLTSNDSLFDVIMQLDTALSNVSGSTLLSLKDVVETTELSVGDILYYNGQNFTFTNIDSIIENYGQIKLSNLDDVNDTDTTDGSVFFYDAATSKYRSAKPFIVIDDLQVTTNHTINHTLGIQYCQITLINMSTNTVINNAMITFTDINVITVALSVAAPIKAIISAAPIFS